MEGKRPMEGSAICVKAEKLVKRGADSTCRAVSERRESRRRDGAGGWGVEKRWLPRDPIVVRRPCPCALWAIAYELQTCTRDPTQCCKGRVQVP